MTQFAFEQHVAVEGRSPPSEVPTLRPVPQAEPPPGRRFPRWGAVVLLVVVVGLGIGLGIGFGGGTSHHIVPSTTSPVTATINTVTINGHAVATRELNPNLIAPLMDTRTAHQVYGGP